jgi:hypothetical protein
LPHPALGFAALPLPPPAPAEPPPLPPLLPPVPVPPLPPLPPDMPPMPPLPPDMPPMLCPAELCPAAEPPVPLPLPPPAAGVPPVEVPAVGEGPAPPTVPAPLEPAVGGLGVASGPLSELHATSAKPARSAVPQAARARDGRRCSFLVTWFPVANARLSACTLQWGAPVPSVSKTLAPPSLFAGFDADRCHVIFSTTCQIHSPKRDH